MANEMNKRKSLLGLNIGPDGRVSFEDNFKKVVEDKMAEAYAERNSQATGKQPGDNFEYVNVNDNVNVNKDDKLTPEWQKEGNSPTHNPSPVGEGKQNDDAEGSVAGTAATGGVQIPLRPDNDGTSDIERMNERIKEMTPWVKDDAIRIMAEDMDGDVSRLSGAIANRAIEKAQAEANKAYEAGTEKESEMREALARAGAPATTIAGAGIVQGVETSRAYWKNLTPEAVNKRIEESLNAISYLDIDAAAKKAGVDTDWYMNNVIASQLQKTIYNKLLEKHVPQSTLEYVASGAFNSIIGQIAETIYYPTEIRQLRAQGRQMAGEHEGTVAEMGNMAVGFLADAPIFKGIGGLVGKLKYAGPNKALGMAIEFAKGGANFGGYNAVSTLTGAVHQKGEIAGEDVLEAGKSFGRGMVTGTAMGAVGALGQTGIAKWSQRNGIGLGTRIGTKAAHLASNTATMAVSDMLLSPDTDVTSGRDWADQFKHSLMMNLVMDTQHMIVSAISKPAVPYKQRGIDIQAMKDAGLPVRSEKELYRWLTQPGQTRNRLENDILSNPKLSLEEKNKALQLVAGDKASLQLRPTVDAVVTRTMDGRWVVKESDALETVNRRRVFATKEEAEAYRDSLQPEIMRNQTDYVEQMDNDRNETVAMQEGIKVVAQESGKEVGEIKAIIRKNGDGEKLTAEEEALRDQVFSYRDAYRDYATTTREEALEAVEVANGMEEGSMEAVLQKDYKNLNDAERKAVQDYNRIMRERLSGKGQAEGVTGAREDLFTPAMREESVEKGRQLYQAQPEERKAQRLRAEVASERLDGVFGKGFADRLDREGLRAVEDLNERGIELTKQQEELITDYLREQQVLDAMMEEMDAAHNVEIDVATQKVNDMSPARDEDGNAIIRIAGIDGKAYVVRNQVGDSMMLTPVELRPDGTIDWSTYDADNVQSRNWKPGVQYQEVFGSDVMKQLIPEYMQEYNSVYGERAPETGMELSVPGENGQPIRLKLMGQDAAGNWVASSEAGEYTLADADVRSMIAQQEKAAVEAEGLEKSRQRQREYEEELRQQGYEIPEEKAPVNWSRDGYKINEEGKEERAGVEETADKMLEDAEGDSGIALQAVRNKQTKLRAEMEKLRKEHEGETETSKLLEQKKQYEILNDELEHWNRVEAYYAYKKEAEKEPLLITRERASLMQKFAEKLGSKLVISDNMYATMLRLYWQTGNTDYLPRDRADANLVNGINANGVIYINGESIRGLLWAFGHESGHSVAAVSKKAYTDYKDAVRTTMGAEAWEEAKQAKRKVDVYGKISEEAIEEEVVNDQIGEIFNDPNKFDTFAKLMVDGRAKTGLKALWNATKKFASNMSMEGLKEAGADLKKEWETVTYNFEGAEKKLAEAYGILEKHAGGTSGKTALEARRSARYSIEPDEALEIAKGAEWRWKELRKGQLNDRNIAHFLYGMSTKFPELMHQDYNPVSNKKRALLRASTIELNHAYRDQLVDMYSSDVTTPRAKQLIKSKIIDYDYALNYYQKWADGELSGMDYWVNDMPKFSKEEKPAGDSAVTVAPIFYSNAQRAVEGIKQEKATPEQWLAMLTKLGGIKAGEDKWMGLSEWLKSRDAKTLTKEEVMKYIQENQIQVEEVKYAEDGMPDPTQKYEEEFRSLIDVAPDDIVEAGEEEVWAWERMIEQYGEDFGKAFDYDGDNIFTRTDETGDNYLYPELVKEYWGDKEINPTRHKYTTRGLKDNREIALVVPTIESWRESDEIHFGDAGNGRAIAWARFGETNTKASGYGGAVNILDEIERKYGSSTDYSNMSDEDAARRAFANYIARPNTDIEWMITSEIPGDVGKERAKNVVALFKKLVADNSKGERVLVIDEIQSKRGQSGRERGFEGERANSVKGQYEAAEKAMREYRKKMKEKYGEYFLSDDLTEEENKEYKRLYRDMLFKSAHKDNKTYDVPDMPFDKNWHELAMKRMLRYAAENGYDKLAWTTGAQQAERYDIGKVIDQVERTQTFGDTGETRFDLQPKDNSGGISLFVKDGMVTRSSMEELEGKPLMDVVGKDLAAKMLEMKDYSSMNIADMQIGAEGMSGFYDKILPSFMNKYCKKWGAQVHEVELPDLEPSAQKMWAVDITPEMKESVMQGQPMFSKEIGRDLAENTNGKLLPNVAGKITREEVEKALESNLLKQWLKAKGKDQGFQLFSQGSMMLRDIARARLGIKNKYTVDGMFYNAADELAYIMNIAKKNGLSADIAYKYDLGNADALKKVIQSGEPMYTEEELKAIEAAIPAAGKDALRSSVQAFENEGKIREEIERIKDYDNGNAVTKAFVLYDIALNRMIDQYKGDEQYTKPNDKGGYSLKANVARELIEEIATTPIVAEEVEAAAKQQRALSDARFSKEGEKGVRRLVEAGLEEDNLAIAKEMREAGKDALAIKMATGWEYGHDGKWKKEDEDLHFKDGVFEEYQSLIADNKTFILKKLPELMNDSRLFTAYPKLKDIIVNVEYNYPKGLKGAYDEDAGWIGLNNRIFEGRNAKNEVEEILAHEVQHIIQDEEGFARGGNPEMLSLHVLVDNMTKEEKNAYSKAIQTQKQSVETLESLRDQGESLREMSFGKSGYKTIQEFMDTKEAKWQPAVKMMKDLEAEYNATKEELNSSMNAARDIRDSVSKRLGLDGMFLGADGYRRLAGEVEARAVGNRVNMWNEYRRNVLTEVDEDVPASEQILKFSKETNPETLEKLNKEKTIKVYRAIRMDEDGTLSSPMEGGGVGGKRKGERVDTYKPNFGEWERADEHPELATMNEGDKYAHITIDKGNGNGTLDVAYNPYIHTSRQMLNDQFSSAWRRPDLQVMEVEIPESELTSGYRADMAKNAVGETEWTDGVVAKQLPEEKRRKVILSRWDKPVRIVPAEEYAKSVAEQLDGTGIKGIPFNCVTPEQREALRKAGVQILEPEKKAGPEAMKAYEEWKNKQGETLQGTDGVQFSKEEADKNEVKKYDEINNTEFARFASFLENGRKLANGEPQIFHIGNTGDLLNKYGLNGKITIKTSSVNPNRHSQKEIEAGSKDWLNVMNNINNPIAITKTRERQRRLYIDTYIDGERCCVVADAHEIGQETFVTNIKTWIPRDIDKILSSNKEELLYPTIEKLKQEIGRKSHNAQASGQSPVSAGKGKENVGNVQENEQKFSKEAQTKPKENENFLDYANRVMVEERTGVDTNPTEAQKEAGNYRKGHIRLDGYNITIENPKGSTRSGKDADGTEWSVKMNYDYGYIRGTKGVDGDHIDVYLGPDQENGKVFVVDQIDQKSGKFDEHKVMYGFPDAESARKAYLSQYEEGWKVGNITPVNKEEFKKWVDSSTRKVKPFSEYASVKTEGDIVMGEADVNSGGNILHIGENAISLQPEDVNYVRKQTESLPKSGAWRSDFPQATILTNKVQSRYPDLYNAAKSGDREAAFELVNKLSESKAVADKIAKLVADYPDAIVAYPHAEEAAGRNKIPALWAAKLESEGLRMTDDIRQINKPNHTGAADEGRLVRRSRFEGNVEKGGKYILLDDQVSSGATLRDMKDYIESQGGEVVQIVGMTASMGGHKIAPTDEHINRLIELGVTDKQLQDYGIAESIRHLTDGEAAKLVRLVNRRADRGASQGPEGNGSLGKAEVHRAESQPREGGHWLDHANRVAKEGLAVDSKPTEADKGIKFSKEDTRTENFKRWFGDWEKDPENASKVVDKNGEPLVVYHGTPHQFNTFSNFWDMSDNELGSGHYFTNNKRLADSYAEPNFDNQWYIDHQIEKYWAEHPDMDFADVENHVLETAFKDGRTIPAYLNMRNPFIIDSVEIPEDAEHAKENGYDGIVDYGFYERHKEHSTNVTKGTIQYIVFEPNQIKSATENNGDYDPNNPDIRYSKEGKSAEWKKAKEELKDYPFALETLRSLEVQDINDVAASVLAGGGLLWGDNGEGPNRKKGVQSMMGWKEGERKNFLSMFAKDGMTFAQAGEAVEQACREEHIPFDENDPNAGVNALQDVLGSVKSMSELTNYVELRRVDEARAAVQDAQNHQAEERNEYYLRNYGMSYDEYMTYQEESAKAQAGRGISEEAQRDINWLRTKNERQAQELQRIQKELDRLHNEELARPLVITQGKIIEQQKAQIDQTKTELNQLKDATRRKKNYEDAYRQLLEVKRDVANFVREQLAAEDMPFTSKKDLNKLLATIEKTNTVEQLQDALREVQIVAGRGRVKHLDYELSKLLRLQIQGLNGKRMSVAKTVDDRTRRIIEDIRGRVQDIGISGMEEELDGLMRERREQRGAINELRTKLKDAEAEEKVTLQAKIDEGEKRWQELSEQIQAKADEISEARESKRSKSVEDLTEEINAIIEQADLLAQDGKQLPKAEADKLTALEGFKILQQSKKSANDVYKLEKGIRDLWSEIYELRAEREGKDDKERQRLNKLIINRKDKIKANEALLADAINQQAFDIQEGINMLETLMDEGRNSLKQKTDAALLRRCEMIKNACADVRNKKNQVDFNRGSNPDIKKNPTWKSFINAPVGSFEYMAQRLGQTGKAGKDSWIYQHFVMGKDGIMEAFNTYQRGLREQKDQLNAKVTEIFGTGNSKLLHTDAWVRQAEKADKIVYDSGVTIVREDGKREVLPLSKGAATYLYMVWKMEDGKSKMLLQGFDNTSMQEIQDFIGKDYMQLADWLQDTFLVGTRAKYNERYRELYNTSMARIENYVPLRVNKDVTRQESDLSEDKNRRVTLEQRAGSLINRTVNNLPVDITKSVFDVISEHVEQMENWYAYSPVRRDLDAILSNTFFRNQVDANNAGHFKRFYDAAAIATQSYVAPPAEHGDALMGMMTKGLLGGNIAWRAATAIKQLYSASAYLGYTYDPMFVPYLTKNAATGALGLNLQWCIDNIPSFKARVDLGDIGNVRISEKVGDISGNWAKKLNKYLQNYMAVGMIPNRVIDAITCSMGAKTIYDYKLRQLKLEIEKDKTLTNEQRQEALKEAHRKAVMEADVFYNSTQQSSNPMFLSPMQVSRTLIDRSLTAYQNNNLGYVRKTLEAAYDLIQSAQYQKMKDAYKDSYMEDGVPEEEANTMARRQVLKTMGKSLLGLFVMGWLNKYLWDKGSTGFFGFWADPIADVNEQQENESDDDYKNRMQWDSFYEWLGLPARPLQGTPMGNYLKSASEKRSWNPLLVFNELDDLKKDFDYIMENDGVFSKELLWAVLNHGMRTEGINLETLGNIYYGLEQMAIDGGDINEKMVDLMFALNNPNKGRVDAAKNLYKDEDFVQYAQDAAKADKYLTKGTALAHFFPWMKEFNGDGTNGKELKREYDKLKKEWEAFHDIDFSKPAGVGAETTKIYNEQVKWDDIVEDGQIANILREAEGVNREWNRLKKEDKESEYPSDYAGEYLAINGKQIAQYKLIGKYKKKFGALKRRLDGTTQDETIMDDIRELRSKFLKDIKDEKFLQNYVDEELE